MYSRISLHQSMLFFPQLSYIPNVFTSFLLVDSLKRRKTCKNDTFEGNYSGGIAGAVRTGGRKKFYSPPKN